MRYFYKNIISINLLSVLIFSMYGFADAATKSELLLALNSGITEDRVMAIKGLSNLNDVTLIPVFIECLADKESSILAFSIIAIKSFEEKSHDPLISALSSKNFIIRGHSAKLLGSLGVRKAANNIALLLKDSESFVKRHALFALSLLGNEEHLFQVLDFLKDEKDADTRRIGVEALSAIKDSRSSSLLLDFIMNDENVFVRETAVYAFYKISGEDGFNELLRVYLTNKLQVKDAIVKIVSEDMNGKPFELLLTTLKNKDMKIYTAAASILGRLDSEKAVMPLIDTLRYDFINVEAIKSLGSLKDNRAIEPLLDLLDSEHEDVRFEAALAISNIDETRAIKVFSKLLWDRSEVNKLKALNELSKNNSKEAKDIIGIAAGRSKNLKVRDEAKKLLKNSN